ncbi:MAG: LPS export ABC transporter periplasmic protein LptC, partial [Nitrospinota bacterium]
MGRLRVFLLLFILGVAGISVFFLLAYSPLKTSLPSIPRISAGLDLRLENVNLVETKDGQKEWELWADRARVYRKRGVTKLDNVRVVVYPEDRKPIRVRSERGTLYNKSRDMELEGNVVVVSEEGYTLTTQRLRWVAGRR